ncbi:DUF366 domain-containing protein [Bdellovibrio sp. qaytius]|nr:DUF366 domain-containing protein [Bdellovibrio sp. qaytius]
METLFVSTPKKVLKNYDGSQLRPLFSYENFGLKGNAMISWISPTDVTLDHMVDYEDKIDAQKICGDKMLHFMIEFFPANLSFGVMAQRLLASIIKDMITQKVASSYKLIRKGDDIYVDGGKLSISIASVSAVSTLVHFAVNITNKGTPVKTASLEDLKIKPDVFAKEVLKAFSTEFEDVIWATQKVKPL